MSSDSDRGNATEPTGGLGKQEGPCQPLQRRPRPNPQNLRLCCLMCKRDFADVPCDGKASLDYPGEPDLITQALKSREPFTRDVGEMRPKERQERGPGEAEGHESGNVDGLWELRATPGRTAGKGTGTSVLQSHASALCRPPEGACKQIVPSTSSQEHRSPNTLIPDSWDPEQRNQTGLLGF